MEDRTYKSMQIRFYEANLTRMLNGGLVAYGSGEHKWEFNLYDWEKDEYLLENTSLRELIELIELGQFCKTHLSDVTLKHTVSRRRRGKQEPDMETVEQATA